VQDNRRRTVNWRNFSTSSIICSQGMKIKRTRTLLCQYRILALTNCQQCTHW